MRDKIIFDRDLHNYLKQLSVEVFAEAFSAICEYAFYDIFPSKGSMGWYTVQIFKPKLDRYILAAITKEQGTANSIKNGEPVYLQGIDLHARYAEKLGGGELNAHHIKHFATHIDLRYCVDNGITLCEKCHKEVHKRERQLCSLC